MAEQAVSKREGRSRKAVALGCAGLLILGSALGVTSFYLLTAVPPPDPATRPLPNPNGYDSVKAALQRLTRGSSTFRPGAGAAEMRKALSKDLPALQSLHAALLLPYQIPPSTLSSTNQSLVAITYNQQVREGARALAGKCRLAKAEGRYGDAMEAALDAIALGVKVPRGGRFIDTLVGNACVAITGTEALSLVERLSLAEVRSSRERVERLLSEAVSEKEVLTEERQALLRDAHGAGRFQLQSRLMTHQFNQVYKEALREADKPSAERQPPPSANSIFGRLVAGTLPDLRKSLDKRDRLLATLRVKLGIEEFRKTHQRLPRSMEELVPGTFPEPPLDPVTRKPLRYRVVGSSYEVAPP